MNKDITILLVDDDEKIINIIIKLLEDDNIDVISATSVREAKVIGANFDIDLLIIDYNLTNGKGFEIIKIAKEEKPNLPVIMISAAGSGIIQSSLEAGVNIFLSKPFKGRELRSTVLNLLSLFEAHENLENANEVIKALARAVEMKDSYTQGHSERVANYSLQLYDAIGFTDEEERNSIAVGCLLHDIGKIGIPDNILKSSKELNEDEKKIIQEHPKMGYEICKDLTKLKSAISVIRNHHEKLDGSGYPDRLKGNDIPTIVQIVTISDIYDALTSDRAYRIRNTPKEAFNILYKDANKGYINKYFVDIFAKLFNK